MSRAGVCAALGALILAAPALAAPALPDWTGAWSLVGPTVFDRATAEPPNGLPGTPGVRERPPYRPAWEAKYLANIEKVKVDRFPDPITQCGTPAGFPRLLNLPDAYEFVVRPEQTWVLTENGPNLLRIYTDGRKNRSGEDLWATYTGDSVGRWEGDTLVFTTVGVKGEQGSILDRTGAVISDKASFTTRMRRLDAKTIEAQITVVDPEALTRPWVVTKRFAKMDGDVRLMDYACAENNRNPVSDSGKTLTLDTKGRVIDRER